MTTQNGIHTKGKLSIKNLKKSLTYKKDLPKIPEQGIKNVENHANLPCANTHSLLLVFDSFFTIVSILYDRRNLKQEVLDHIRSNYSYYKLSTYKLLTKKKLDLVDWLAGMQTKNLPADKICLLACARMLKIHVSIDYITGCWTTFETSNISHDYITDLLDIHLLYRGSCKYNLLCRSCDLKTIGWKLLDHKLYNIELTKPVSIILTRIEDWPDNNENTTQTIYDSDTTELYYVPGSPTPSNPTTNKPIESDTTEIYDISTDDEFKTKHDDNKEHNLNESGYTSNNNPTSDENNKTIHMKQLFKCKIKKCAMKLNSRKELYQHHRTTHRGLHKCTNCHKKYRTPYSLYQHNYIHRTSSQLWNCSKCKMSFAFKSQLIIHKNSHTKHGKFECSECFTNF